MVTVRLQIVCVTSQNVLSIYPVCEKADLVSMIPRQLAYDKPVKEPRWRYRTHDVYQSDA